MRYNNNTIKYKNNRSERFVKFLKWFAISVLALTFVTECSAQIPVKFTGVSSPFTMIVANEIQKHDAFTLKSASDSSYILVQFGEIRIADTPVHAFFATSIVYIYGRAFPISTNIGYYSTTELPRVAVSLGKQLTEGLVQSLVKRAAQFRNETNKKDEEEDFSFHYPLYQY
jgi:hypothetical protein